MRPAAIEITELTKTFVQQRGWRSLLTMAPARLTRAVDRLTLTVGEGEIFGVLGPNGAGKTTLVKLLCTLLLPTSGRAAIFGHDVVRDGSEARRLIGLLTSDERSFYWRLSGRDNLRFFAATSMLSSDQAETRIDTLADLLGIGGYIDQRFNEYSTGMKQKLAIARGLLSRPRLLFMDEPTKGLDPVASHAFLGLIKETIVPELKGTIVVCTNSTREAEELCDRIAIINRGQLIYLGTPEELKSATGTTEVYRIRFQHERGDPVPAVPPGDGIVEAAVTHREEGLTELRLEVARGSTALSQLLRHFTQVRWDLVSLSKEEIDFDEVIRKVMKNPERLVLEGGRRP